MDQHPPGDLRSGLRACGVDQLPWATWARVPGPTGLTSCPGQLGNRSVVLRGRPAHPGDSGSCPMARGVEQLSRRTRARIRWPARSTIYPRLLWLGSGASGVEYTPGRLGLMSIDLRGRPSVPCDSGPGPMVQGVDQLSQTSRALFRGPAVWTSSPGRLAPGSDNPRGPSALQGD